MDVGFIGLGRMGGAVAASMGGVAGFMSCLRLRGTGSTSVNPGQKLICNDTSRFDGVESLATDEPICALDFPLRVADQAGAAHENSRRQKDNSHRRRRRS